MATIPVRIAGESDSTYIARLTAELSRAKTPSTDGGFKVSDKGGISVYSLGRFPVTLYYEQWVKLVTVKLGFTMDQFEASPLGRFAAANMGKLKLKADEKAETPAA